jgi:hypothetical protein
MRSRRAGVVVGLGIGALVAFAVPAGAQTPSPFPSAVDMCYVTGIPVTSTSPFPTATVPGTPAMPPPATIPCHVLEVDDEPFPWGKLLRVLVVPAFLVSAGIRAMRSRA